MGRAPALTLLGAAALAAVVGACGDTSADLLQEEGVGRTGKVVGGPCASDPDCELGSRCLRGGDFPGGTCTSSCVGDGRCPSGAACIKEEHGICLTACTTPADCRAGYSCEGKDRLEGNGDALVCIGDDHP